MPEIQITDESGDKDYFVMLPTYIANHSTANDQALYWQMKRYAGEYGRCFATEKTLMSKLGIGKKAYNTALNYLLDNKWVSFTGLTNGKTRPIKTYKINNIWKLNHKHYEKIPSESTLSLKDKFQKEGDKFQKHYKISSESTIEEDISINKNINKKENAIAFSDKDRKELIFLFKEINPNYELFYSRKNQAQALERMFNRFGRQKLENTIKALPSIIYKKYAPKITTPIELENNLAKLIAFYKQETSKVVNKTALIL